MNRLVISGALTERSATRSTPAGLLAIDALIRHEGESTEDGSVRKVNLNLRAVFIGEVASEIQKVDLGVHRTFAGFLSSGHNGRGTLFHVTELS